MKHNIEGSQKALCVSLGGASAGCEQDGARPQIPRTTELWPYKTSGESSMFKS